MNPIPLASTYEASLPSLYEVARRAVDGTVPPILVDYTNSRVSIGSTTASTASSSQALVFPGNGTDFDLVATTITSTGALSLYSTTNAALKTYFADVSGGTRLWLWDNTRMVTLNSTNLLPGLAVKGDLAIGDIHAIESNPMTYFMRINSGLASTATTQLFSARAVNNDTDGGAGIIYAPCSNTASDNGYIQLVAYGRGAGGGITNSIAFYARNGAGTVQKLAMVTTAGFTLSVGSITFPDSTQQTTAFPSSTNPTKQIFTSGSGTYTTPAGVKYITIRMVGGGGGGGGDGTSAGSGGNGGNSTFSTITASGGAGGNSNGSGGGGGGSSGGDINLSGGAGGNGFSIASIGVGGPGASSPFGGAGPSPTTGTHTGGSSAQNNTGSGASGGISVTTGAAGGGGASGYSEKLISSPSATYSYAVGAGGSAGTAGTGGDAGGVGGSGLIIVEEHYTA